MNTTPVSPVTTCPILDKLTDPRFVDRIADKVRALAAVKPPLVRVLEWQIDQELERAKKGGRG